MRCGGIEGRGGEQHCQIIFPIDTTLLRAVVVRNAFISMILDNIEFYRDHRKRDGDATDVRIATSSLGINS